MNNTKDMTAGSPARHIFFFAIPLMLGNVFQQLYTMVDTIIVGQGVGVKALAALGAADWLNWLVLGLVTGFTQGFCIRISQLFGAEDYAGMRRAAALSCVLSAVLAVALTAVSLLTLRPVLEFLNTDPNIIDNTTAYLTVIFAGIAVITVYNLFAAFLRAMGDSRTPLIAMVIASLINIGLDLLFVMVFHWGVVGAAVATVIAQVFSCLFCLFAVLRLPIMQLKRADFAWDRRLAGKLVGLGAPIAFQNFIISAGGLAVQYVINGFGFLFVAGFTATNKLYGLLEVAATSFGFSITTYTGQNLGARKYERIRKGMRSAIWMAIGTAALIGLCMILFGRPILSLFVSGEPDEIEQVLNIASIYLTVMSSMLIILYLLYVYRSALQGMGDTLVPMLSGIAELALRVTVAMFLPRLVGRQGVYFCEIAAWIAADLVLIPTYYWRIHKLLPRTHGKKTRPA